MSFDPREQDFLHQIETVRENLNARRKGALREDIEDSNNPEIPSIDESVSIETTRALINYWNEPGKHIIFDRNIPAKENKQVQRVDGDFVSQKNASSNHKYTNYVGRKIAIPQEGIASEPHVSLTRVGDPYRFIVEDGKVREIRSVSVEEEYRLIEDINKSIEIRDQEKQCLAYVGSVAALNTLPIDYIQTDENAKDASKEEYNFRRENYPRKRFSTLSLGSVVRVLADYGEYRFVVTEFGEFGYIKSGEIREIQDIKTKKDLMRTVQNQKVVSLGNGFIDVRAVKLVNRGEYVEAINTEDEGIQELRTPVGMTLNDEVVILEENDDYLAIRVPITHSNFRTLGFDRYPNDEVFKAVWIRKDLVHIGYKRFNLNQIYNDLYKMINYPYAWGGAEIWPEPIYGGGDCSKEAKRALAACGIQLPNQTEMIRRMMRDKVKTNPSGYTEQGIRDFINTDYDGESVIIVATKTHMAFIIPDENAPKGFWIFDSIWGARRQHGQFILGLRNIEATQIDRVGYRSGLTLLDPLFAGQGHSEDDSLFAPRYLYTIKLADFIK